jgi:hypothetical protein
VSKGHREVKRSDFYQKGFRNHARPQTDSDSSFLYILSRKTWTGHLPPLHLDFCKIGEFSQLSVHYSEIKENFTVLELESNSKPILQLIIVSYN